MATSAHPDSTPTPVSVLVVDDEPDMLEMARLLLEAAACRVDTATDGRLGLIAARAKQYDVIVLDITMPHMDGIELGHALRADPATRGARLVVHSALNEAWVRSLFPDFDRFLSKPEDAAHLTRDVLELASEGGRSAPASRGPDGHAEGEAAA